MTPPADARSIPRAEYARRLQSRRDAAAKQARLDLAISNGRLAVGLAAAVVAWLAFGGRVLSPAWLAAPGLVFLLLVVLHERAIRSRRRAERAASFYERCLARLAGDWAGKGEDGRRFLDDAHIYAADLDLFGPGCLFELLCTARTRAGEEALAAWLRAPASPREVRARQTAVEELRGRIDLREDLALLGEDARAGLDPAALASWATAPPVLPAPGRPMWPGRAAAALLALAAGAAWATGLTGWRPLAVVVLVEAVFALRLRPRVLRVVGAVERSGRDLALLAQLLERIEREPLDSTRLAELRSSLKTRGLPPSRQIARLGRLIVLLDARRNQLFAPFAGALLWATRIACAIEAWRVISGEAVPRWLEVAGEFEALCALAGYAYESPEDPFPRILDGAQEVPSFLGEGIGHPLIPESRSVRNDVHLGGDPGVLIVSGSNMSGKSTLLRTVGVNVVLAQAGAPVRARALSLTPLAVGASIRILDSLQAGTSRFYAEITRLREIMELTGRGRPVLFLLDEILHGTNSHDRRAGAEAVVKGLARRGAIGLVTTHDLALADIAEALAPHAANVHFEDQLENGRMTFDYRLQPGVVRKSNALALMRSVGLEV